MPANLSHVRPVDSLENLRGRVVRLFSSASSGARKSRQFTLALPSVDGMEALVPHRTLSGFIDFLSSSLPGGDVYIFGGVLRDLALFGKSGFNSDVDLVVEGDWREFVGYLESCGAKRNRFGGYRLQVGEWPIDIWNAKETWAIRQGFVEYSGIGSLINTTVLNWDAILMNWRTKRFVCDQRYLISLRERALDIVLEENPNPMGMAVRVFRHLSHKDAKSVSHTAVAYLGKCTKRYSFDELKRAEMRSYGDSIIDPALFLFFEELNAGGGHSIFERYKSVVSSFEKRGLGVSLRQLELRL